jgi:hypothetical protein
MIEKIILQTSRLKLNNNYVNRIKSFFDEEYLYYNFYKDDDIINYFLNNPIEGFENIIEKYYSLKSGAHKSDLFRYYFLYLNGGFYFDDDVMIYNRLDEFLFNYDLIIVKSNVTNNSIFNGIIGCNKNNPIIFKALEDVYKIDNLFLLKDYHLLCKNLKKITELNSTNQRIKYFNENRVIYFDKYGYDIIKEKKALYFRHFWSKNIIDIRFKVIENYAISFCLFFLYKIFSYYKKFKFNIISKFKFLINMISKLYYILRIYGFDKYPICLSGPFKGLKYIKTSSWGPIFPKLLGTYEEPIFPWIEYIIKNKYSTIINIGSGEGYYAAGFAQFSKISNVFAFDIDNKALGLLSIIKKINNLTNLTSSNSISNTIINDLITNKCLIFLDIEGGEYTLLNIDNIPNLFYCDILVELHEIYIPNITEILSNRFYITHEIEIIKDNNFRKIDSNLLNKISKGRLINLVNEHRPSSMSWMFLKCKLSI